MKLRILLISAVFVLSGLALAPMATAQAPANYYRVTFEWAHGEMTVPDTGRADMDLEVKLEASGFVCVGQTPCRVSVELKLDSFAKWAGASLEPFTAEFEIPNGQPGANPQTYESTEDIKLNLAWDLETAPRAGAKQVYVVTANPKMDGTTLPSPQPSASKSLPMEAMLPDRPVEINSTSPVDCSSDPFNPVCATMGSTAAAESPAMDPVILLASLAVFAVVLRRRRA